MLDLNLDLHFENIDALTLVCVVYCGDKKEEKTKPEPFISEIALRIAEIHGLHDPT